jgi:uncharacterized protein
MKIRQSIINVLVLLFFISGTVTLFSQDIPEKPNPPRLVNDFAGLLNGQEINALEQKLVAFNDSTSTQIAIVVVKDLFGYDKADYATRLGDKWGIGQKGKNNGILILIKPKTVDSNGEVEIATGYGAEGAVPDLVCSDIVNNDILPAFRRSDYYGGLDKATSTIISMIRGEFTADQYSRQHKGITKKIPLGALIVIIFVIIALFSSGKSNHNNISRSGLPFWILLGMINSGRSSGGSWGGFSGGGGGGGGFGGFGGGGFGVGGAGGSW